MSPKGGFCSCLSQPLRMGGGMKEHNRRESSGQLSLGSVGPLQNDLHVISSSRE